MFIFHLTKYNFGVLVQSPPDCAVQNCLLLILSSSELLFYINILLFFLFACLESLVYTSLAEISACFPVYILYFHVMYQNCET